MNAYFPAGQWFTYPTLELYSNSLDGEHKDIELPWEAIGLFVRGSSILSTQNPLQTTHETRKGNFRLLVVLNSTNDADGELYWDDGKY